MATFRELLYSKHGSSPQYLIHISNPFNDDFYLTNSKRTITVGTNIYQPTNLEVSRNIFSKQDETKNTVVVRISLNSYVSDFLWDRQDAQKWSVSIYGYDKNASDTPLLFVGYINKYDDDIVKWLGIQCVTAYNLMESNGLINKFSVTCPYDLYDSNCKINTNSFTDTCTVSVGVDLKSFTLSNLSVSRPSGWYNNGYIIASDTGYTTNRIVYHVGNTVYVTSPVSKDKLHGKVCTIVAGCDKSHTTCSSKFGNLANFGGQPLIPSISPNRSRSI